jgi:hypothetical protein
VGRALLALLAALCVAAVCTSAAAVANEIGTELELKWAALSILAREGPSDNMQMNGFSLEFLAPLRDYVARGNAAMAEQVKEDSRIICDHGPYKSIEEAARAYDAALARYNKLQQGLLDNLNTVLDDNALRALDLLREEYKGSGQQTDVGAILRAGQIDPSDVVHRSCEIANYKADVSSTTQEE